MYSFIPYSNFRFPVFSWCYTVKSKSDATEVSSLIWKKERYQSTYALNLIFNFYKLLILKKKI